MMYKQTYDSGILDTDLKVTWYTRKRLDLTAWSVVPLTVRPYVNHLTTDTLSSHLKNQGD